MSRGLGKVQKRIIEFLEIGGECGDQTEIEFCDFAWAIWGDYELTLSRSATLSRAVRTLIERGLVKKRDMTDAEMMVFRDQEEENQSVGMGFRAKMVSLKQRVRN